MLIVTNFTSFPSRWEAANGESGTSCYAATAAEFLTHAHKPAALFVVNCDPRLTLQLAGSLLFKRHKPPLIAVDVVLRRPTAKERLTLPLKRWLFSRVDHYIHYFRDLRAMQQVFGIGPEQSSYVPFKVNLKGVEQVNEIPGTYVLCFGRSMRDYDTFFSAMETLPYPGAIARPDLQQLAKHCSRFTRPLSGLPHNIQILDDDGSTAAQIRILHGAKLVVLPIVNGSMVASGISTCLNAMRMGKCVIGSEGPGMGDVFSAEEALIVPPEDPPALARMISKAWEDDALRVRTATSGYHFAVHAGGEQQLYGRIIEQLLAWKRTRSHSA